MTYIRQRTRALNSGTLPLFVWAEENERSRIRHQTPFAKHIARRIGINAATAIAHCDALGLGGEAFND